jgi:predicted component of viral defense system (DUF524 family)
VPLREIKLDLINPAGVARGQLVIAELPRRGLRAPHEDPLTELREGSTYRYTISGLEGVLSFEPSELFECDDEAGHGGRLSPKLHVGRLAFLVRTSYTTLSAAVDVAPAKLAQVREYQQMLDDIAQHATEAILQGFAPTTVDLVSAEKPAELLYQQFALLAARLQSEDFVAAMGRILHRPHQSWEAEVESRPVGSGYPSGSAFARAVAAPGPRRQWPGSSSPALASLPSLLASTRYEPTADTPPNRFVKFALEGWRALAERMLASMSSMEGAVQAGPIRRGREAAKEVLHLLDEFLGHELFRGVGRLDHMPTGNQVLLRRAGYRQIFHTFALVETGVALSFDRLGMDDPLSASQRNVATLYEFWCYLVLVDVIGELCGIRQTARAFTPATNGLTVTLRAGDKSALSWEVVRHGRRLVVDLFFNRQFSVLARGSRDGSWSRAMRPDCSIRVRPVSDVPHQAKRGDLDVWLHFDAKYRVDLSIPPGGSQEAQQAVDAEDADSFAHSKREDLLKMHAYRDAIRRTAGAYVLYPGDAPAHFREFSELLPGLGAFPLRPNASGEPGGVDSLTLFLNDVLTHVSRQASMHERDRFWSAAINERGSGQPVEHPPAPFLDRPPADTDVLLGYVRSPEQLNWIQRTQSYNVRAGRRPGSVQLHGRELSAPLLLLYKSAPDGLRVVHLARRGSWRAAEQVDLRNTGYPDPGGRLYFVTGFEPIEDIPAWLSRVDLERLRPGDRPRGAPFVKTWWELLASASAD